MTQHKQAEMIKAKADNMELVNADIFLEYSNLTKSFNQGSTSQVAQGQVITSVGGDDFEIISIHCNRLCLVRFVETGNYTITSCNNAKIGKVKNRYKRSVAAVGFLGYGVYSPKSHPKFYATWTSHISKCYDPNHRDFDNYGGIGWVICNEWHNFQVFAAWCELTCNDDSLLLDKDANDEGLKIIRPTSCAWVTPMENIVSGNLSKLTLQSVNLIKEEYISGTVSMRVLAYKYGVSCSVISNIINNKAWKDA